LSSAIEASWRTRQRLDLALGEGASRVAGGEADQAQDLAARRQRDRAHGAVRLGGQAGRSVGEGGVVVDDHRPARAHDRPAEPGAPGQAVALEPVEQPGPDPAHELRGVVGVLEQVQEAVLTPTSGGAVQTSRSSPAARGARQLERHLVHGGEVRVLAGSSQPGR
jgi:hypothetical protein